MSGSKRTKFDRNHLRLPHEADDPKGDAIALAADPQHRFKRKSAYYQMVSPDFFVETAAELHIDLRELSEKLGMSPAAAPRMVTEGKARLVYRIACQALVGNRATHRMMVIPCRKKDVKAIRSFAIAMGLKSIELDLS